MPVSDRSRPREVRALACPLRAPRVLLPVPHQHRTAPAPRARASRTDTRRQLRLLRTQFGTPCRCRLPRRALSAGKDVLLALIRALGLCDDRHRCGGHKCNAAKNTPHATTKYKSYAWYPVRGAARDPNVWTGCRSQVRACCRKSLMRHYPEDADRLDCTWPYNE